MFEISDQNFWKIISEIEEAIEAGCSLLYDLSLVLWKLAKNYHDHTFSLAYPIWFKSFVISKYVEDDIGGSWFLCEVILGRVGCCNVSLSTAARYNSYISGVLLLLGLAACEFWNMTMITYSSFKVEETKIILNRILAYRWEAEPQIKQTRVLE